PIVTGGARGRREMQDPERGIAGVHRARVAIIENRRAAGHALPRVARLGTVAWIAVTARRSRDGRGMKDPDHGIAGVDGTGIAIGDRWRRAGDALPHAVARLDAVACVAVAARGSMRHGNVNDPSDGIASIEGAGVVVIQHRREPGEAVSGTITGLLAVAR